MSCGSFGIVAGLAFALLGAPLVADAQQPAKVARLGILSSFSPRLAPWYQGF